MATVFVSCGQFTPDEKALGKDVCEIVRMFKHEPYFAETQSNLQGLHENILSKLFECSGFITVMHPRGRVRVSPTSYHIRGSVWVEQEIAIAAFMTHCLKRKIEVAAFIHEDIKREGIRDLLHLNPVSFRVAGEVREKLPGIISNWHLEAVDKSIPSVSVSGELKAFGPLNYFYRNNNTEGPYCPFCWQNDKKEVLLPAVDGYFTGQGRLCVVCNKLFIEEPKTLPSNPSSARMRTDVPRR